MKNVTGTARASKRTLGEWKTKGHASVVPETIDRVTCPWSLQCPPYLPLGSEVTLPSETMAGDGLVDKVLNKEPTGLA